MSASIKDPLLSLSPSLRLFNQMPATSEFASLGCLSLSFCASCLFHVLEACLSLSLSLSSCLFFPNSKRFTTTFVLQMARILLSMKNCTEKKRREEKDAKENNSEKRRKVQKKEEEKQKSEQTNSRLAHEEDINGASIVNHLHQLSILGRAKGYTFLPIRHSWTHLLQFITDKLNFDQKFNTRSTGSFNKNDLAFYSSTLLFFHSILVSFSLCPFYLCPSASYVLSSVFYVLCVVYFYFYDQFHCTLKCRVRPKIHSSLFTIHH